MTRDGKDGLLTYLYVFVAVVMGCAMLYLSWLDAAQTG